MKNYLKLTGLMMMSALLCLFTSCSKDDDEKAITGGVASVEVQLAISAQSLDLVEGSFIVTFEPSGRTEEIRVNNILFSIDANPVTDAELIKCIRSEKAKKYTFKTTCDRSETKISVKPNINIKPGVTIKDDAQYPYEVSGIINYDQTFGSGRSSRGDIGDPSISGSGFAEYVARYNKLSLIWIELGSSRK